MKEEIISDRDYFMELNDLILIIAATDDRNLNRKLVDGARKHGCYGYAVDDREFRK